MGKWKKEKRRANPREPETGENGRSLRLQELIREEVNFLLRNEIRNPHLDGVVATMVHLTPDGSCARIWFTSETDDGQLEALEGAVGFLRSQLAESLGCKKTPELRFQRDPMTRSLVRTASEGPPERS